MKYDREQKLLASVSSAIPFENMGLADSRIPKSLSFVDSERFVEQICSNGNIVGVITTENIASKIQTMRGDLAFYLAEDPRDVFYSAYNERARKANSHLPLSVIDPSAQIHPRAYVAEKGVVIGPNVQIEPMVTVMPGVEVGSNSIIRAGSTLGVEGFEHKRVSRGLVSVVHDRKVIIGEHVEIGANNTVARGLMGEDTRVGDHTKTDCLVHIAHCAQIGERCLIPAAAMIAGSAIIGDDVWIGPNSSISSQLKIGNGAFVTLGAVVVRDVPEGGRVTGNFAISHQDFVRRMRYMAKKVKD